MSHRSKNGIQFFVDRIYPHVPSSQMQYAMYGTLNTLNRFSQRLIDHYSLCLKTWGFTYAGQRGLVFRRVVVMKGGGRGRGETQV